MSEHHRTPEWQRTTRENRPRIRATLPAQCIDCGRMITAKDKWQVGHRVSVAEAKRQGWTVQQINDLSNLGPTHAKAPGQKACNQIAGGRLGAQIRTANAAAKTAGTRREGARPDGMPAW